MSWCTIESDPSVFTELLQRIGVQQIQVEEIYDLSLQSFERLSPIYGLIFLFKWTPEHHRNVIQTAGNETNNTSSEIVRQCFPDGYPNVYFAKQIVNNACATQAILSVIFNCPQLQFSEELATFREFTTEFPADLRGEAIGCSDLLREVHNSFARPEPFIVEDKEPHNPEDQEDVFHFIGYVPVGNTVFELDGLQAGPISIGSVPPTSGLPASKEYEQKWLEVALAAVQDRVGRFESSEIRFSLLAIVKDHSVTLNESLATLLNELSSIETTLAQGTALPDAERSPLESRRQSIQLNIEEIRSDLAEEERKHAQWKAENIRRKQNYFPFIYQLLETLAEKKVLSGLAEHAKKVATERHQRAVAAAAREKELKKQKQEPSANASADQSNSNMEM